MKDCYCRCLWQSWSVGDVKAAASATGKEERERDAEAAAAVELSTETASAAKEMEERAEAQFGEAPAVEVEEPEVPRGCERAMMCICPPYPFRTGKTRVLS